MTKRIIFLGGSKGVGKTSLAKGVADALKFEYINTGDRFRRYRPSFDKMFAQEIINSTQNLLIDTHYAASSSKTPYDLHMGIDEKYLAHIRFNSNYEGAVYLITASPERILSRRTSDGDSRRCLELPQIINENNFNDVFSSIYASWLNLPKHVFKNEGFIIEEAISKLVEELKK